MAAPAAAGPDLAALRSAALPSAAAVVVAAAGAEAVSGADSAARSEASWRQSEDPSLVLISAVPAPLLSVDQLAELVAAVCTAAAAAAAPEATDRAVWALLSDTSRVSRF